MMMAMSEFIGSKCTGDNKPRDVLDMGLAEKAGAWGRSLFGRYDSSGCCGLSKSKECCVGISWLYIDSRAAVSGREL